MRGLYTYELICLVCQDYIKSLRCVVHLSYTAYKDKILNMTWSLRWLKVGLSWNFKVSL